MGMRNRSADVCSSDLSFCVAGKVNVILHCRSAVGNIKDSTCCRMAIIEHVAVAGLLDLLLGAIRFDPVDRPMREGLLQTVRHQIGRASWRVRVCAYV